MALRKIVRGNDPILRKPCREVTVFNGRLHQLLDDMYETMMAAPGVGLAACQVAVLRRVVTIDVGEGRLELINPKVTRRSEELEFTSEGCLSFPGQWGIVGRPKQVTVQAQNRYGDFFEITGEDLLARALCHELDHLDGVVFLDLADEMLDQEEE